MLPIHRQFLCLLVTCLVLLRMEAHAAKPIAAPEGWSTATPRDELKPEFHFEPKGGPNKSGSWMIETDAREGLHGFWAKPVAIEGGHFYAFHALRRVKNVSTPRRCAVARILWQDAQGKSVLTEEKTVTDVLQGFAAGAEPEYPGELDTDKHGWTEIAGVYRAPAKAAQAVIELHFQWAIRGRVEWSDVSLIETNAPPPRKVRLAVRWLFS